MTALFEYSDQFRCPAWMAAVRLLVVLAAAWGIASVPSVRRLTNKAVGSPALAALIAVVAWLVLFSAGMLRHLTFHSKAWDLAIFDQVIWNLANGNGWECSVRGVQDLRGDHFEPVLLAFVPVYKLFPHVGWLLGVQAAAIVGTGILLWATYRRAIGENAALALLVAFMFYPPVHWLALADFHPITLGMLFVAAAWWGRERGRVVPFVFGLAALASCGEEGFIVAGWWGFWEFVTGTPWRRQTGSGLEGNRAIGWLGLVLGVFFWAGFVYLSTIYIPSHRAEGEGYFYIHRYGYLGGSLREIAANFFTKPWLWLGHLFEARSFALLALYLVPLALLPLLSPRHLTLLLPVAVYTLLSESPEQKSIFHQYTAMWIPFLMIAAAEAVRIGAARYGGLKDRAKAALALASFLAFLAFSPLFGLSMHPELLQPEHWAGEAKGVVESVKADQAVSAPSALCPHLSHRRVLLLKPNDRWPGADEVLILPDFPPQQLCSGQQESRLLTAD